MRPSVLRIHPHLADTKINECPKTKLLPALPLLIMSVAAVVFVWRGFDTKPDGTNYRAKGGGAKWNCWS